MTEFRVRTFAPGRMEVEQPSTGHAWQFAIDKAADGRRMVTMQTTTPAEAAEGNTMQAALDYARATAIKAGRADG